jgi:acyl carrier protein
LGSTGGFGRLVKRKNTDIADIAVNVENGFTDLEEKLMKRDNRKKMLQQSSLTAEIVLERLRACLPSVELKADQPLSHHNIDSIDLVELLCTIDAEFGVRITEADLGADPTLAQLAVSVIDRSLDLSHSHSHSL